MLFLLACTTPDDTATPPPADTPADTGSPESADHDDCIEDRYTARVIQGWAVCIETTVLDDAAHGEAVLALLESDLSHILTVLEPEVSGFLQGVRIWVEHDHADWGGAVYHPSATWLEENGYPTHWAESVQIGSTADYLSWTEIQPAIVLHELSHAWHHQSLGYDDASVQQAYDAALASGIYDSVPYAGGGKSTAYATTSVQEYFAELTEAWFWENDFYPFVREELQSFDPVGAAMVEAAWQP